MCPQSNVEKFAVCCQYLRAMSKVTGLLSVGFGKHPLVMVMSYRDERNLGSSEGLWIWGGRGAQHHCLGRRVDGG